MTGDNNRVMRRRDRRQAQQESHNKRLRIARISRIVLMMAIGALMYLLIQRMGAGPANTEGALVLSPDEVAILGQTTLRVVPDASPSATPKPEPLLPAAMPTEVKPTMATHTAATQELSPAAEPTPSTEDATRHAALLEAGLTDVRVLEGVRIDMRYASDRNFMGAAMYPGDGCYLASGTAVKLAAAQAYAREHGVNILVLDAYRPLRYQQVLYDAVEDKRFVADPKNASRHNRGAALDVTLCDDAGAPLPMPSEYDVFTDAATRAYDGADEAQTANRALLTEVMTRAGFTTIQSEWWHYDDSDWRKYPVLDRELPAWKGEMP